MEDVIRANKKYAGQTCNICKKEIELGETIHICPNCHGINHEDCWQNEGGCPKFSCNSLSNNYQNNSSYKNTSPSTLRPNPLSQPQKTSNTPNSFNQQMIACRWCKEPIPRGSKKCPHCGEFQKDADREKAKKDDTEEDTSIPSGMWVLIILYPDIAFIFGIVIMCRGKLISGAKTMGVSLISFLIKVAIRLAILK